MPLISEAGFIASLNYAIFGFAGLITNMALLVVLFRIRNEKTPFTRTLASLAIANITSDVCFATFGIVFALDSVKDTLDFSEWSFFYNMIHINRGFVMIALSHVILIAIQRFVAVQFPFHFKRVLTTRVILIMLCLCWLIPIALLLPAFFDVKEYNEDRILSYSFLTLGFALVFCYTWILNTLRIQYRLSRTMRNINNSSSNKKQNLKLLLNSVGVTVLFITLVSPFAVSTLTGEDEIRRYLLSSLIVVRTVVDPLVYFVVSLCGTCSRCLPMREREQEVPKINPRESNPCNHSSGLKVTPC